MRLNYKRLETLTNRRKISNKSKSTPKLTDVLFFIINYNSSFRFLILNLSLFLLVMKVCSILK